MEPNAYSTSSEPVIEYSRVKRNIFARIMFSLLWLIPIVLAVNMIVGGIVGGIAGSGVSSMEEATVAGQAAAEQYFANNGGILFLIEFFVWLGLSIAGMLPGTAKFKRA